MIRLRRPAWSDSRPPSSLIPVGRAGARHILDAGCGDGAFLAFMHRLGFRVTGIELAEGAATRARRRCPDADVWIASLEETLPFDDQAFDAIWCTEVLEHLFHVHWRPRRAEPGPPTRGGCSS